MYALWIKRLFPTFAARERVRRAVWWPVDFAEGVLRIRPTFVAPRGMRFVGGSPQLAVREYREFYFPLADLRHSDHVLDVGCGVGYLAMALLLDGKFRGRYLGFDIVPFAVAWCRRAITREHPEFEFCHADLFNRQYNPRGTLRSTEFHFPCDSASQDKVFLKSVFTHLMPDETIHYLGEIRRVLRPGGRCVFSVFLPDAPGPIGSATKPAIAFHWQGADYAVHDPLIPEAAIGFSCRALQEWVAAAGLSILQISLGSWRGGGGGHMQDLVVCTPV